VPKADSGWTKRKRFYPDALSSIGTIAISMGATLLFATALAAMGRNQAIALAVGIVYWLVESVAAFLLGAAWTSCWAPRGLRGGRHIAIPRRDVPE
jgi:hypothetical protein